MSCLITGTGAIASVGGTVNEICEALRAGHSGLAPLRGFDSGKFRAKKAYEIDDRPASGGDVPARATDWLLRAVAESLREAGVGEDLSDVPVLVGTGLRELRSVELKWRDGAEFDLDRLHFGTALRERFGATQTYTFANACSASLHTLALGSDMIATGQADTVVIAGVDAITESMFGLLDRVQLDPPDRVRPFDQARRGTLMGDGAAAVVLRRDDPAAVPGARGRLRATSMNCDASHATAPDAHSIAEAIRAAHGLAGVKTRDIDLVLLHGTGTPLNDDAEAVALGDVFGADIDRPLMTALKSMTGHTSGGSGLLSLIVALRALESGRAPAVDAKVSPAAGAERFRFVQDHRADVGLRLAQINAFGFGGVNAVAVVERVDD